MNNTKRTTLAIVAIFMAATFVVGTLATTTTQSAFAYSQKKDNGKGNDNGNTVTIEKCKNKGSASGFDTAVDQECENLICTHPGDNATCKQGVPLQIAPAPTTYKSCVECFMTLLKQEQLNNFLSMSGFSSIVDFCDVLKSFNLQGLLISKSQLRVDLDAAGITSIATQNELIACLMKTGLVFGT